jgi:anaerobic nitric oxide reductase transcription regulator
LPRWPSGALNNALLIEQLESQNILPGSPAAFEQVTHTEMIGLSPGMVQLKKRSTSWPPPI